MPMDYATLYMLMNSPKSPDAGKDPFRTFAMMNALGGMMTPQAASGGGLGGAPRQANPVGDALDSFQQQMMMRRMMEQMSGQKSSGGIMDMFGMGGGSSKGGGAGAGMPTSYTGMEGFSPTSMGFGIG